MVLPRIPVLIQSSHFFYIAFESGSASWHVIRDKEDHVEKFAAAEDVVYYEN